VTFAATAAVASGRLTPASATNPTSTGEAEPPTDNGSAGEETYTFTTLESSGNPTSTTTATNVTWNVQNTGSRTIWIIEIDGFDIVPAIPVEPGTTQTVNGTIAAGATTSTIQLDRTSTNADTANAAFASASITAFLTGNASITGTATKTWVSALPEPGVVPGGPAGTASAVGTVLAVDKTADFYILNTAQGPMQITYRAGNTFILSGAAVDLATWEAALTVGDTVAFTDDGGAENSVGEVHNITINQ
ncbi:MAG TPA: hypothetical protein VMT18_09775, partial [Planctomycetota bacterium]|nr:hypothetical protein [Planctomycetota bacterium]